MPRTKKTDKFFLYAARKSGFYKGKRLMGTNHLHEDGDRLSVQDLLEFLKQHNIDPSKVLLPRTFTTYAVE